MKLAYKLSLLVICVGLLLCIPLIKAQDTSQAPAPHTQDLVDHPDHQGNGHDKGGGPRQMIDRLKKKLSLTTDQVNQVTTIFKNHDAALKALRDNSEISKEERHSRSEVIFKQIQSEVRAKLNADQQAILDEMPPLGPPGHPGHGKRKDAGNPPPSN